MAPSIQRLPGVDGVSLHALVWPGDSTPFLLVHGLSSNCRTWEAVGEHLHRRGYAVAAVDLRGHGQSDKPDDGYDFATFTADLLSVIDALGYERPVVAGQSTGGNVAVELALKAPERVTGIAGVDGGLIELVDQWPTWEECRDNLSPPPIAGTPAADFERMIRRAHPDWSDEGVAATAANVEIGADGTIRPWLTPERHLRILRALWEQRPSSQLPALAVPLLLLLADTRDSWAVAKRREIERAQRLARRCKAVWFTPADHDLHVQQPATVTGVLVGALGDGFFHA